MPCTPAASPAWRVDGQTPPGDGRCKLALTAPAGASRVLELQLGGAHATKKVELKDRLVVALGDSVASGEGNPGPGGRWLERRCHRSAAAGFEQAARLVAAANPASSLTFVNLGCSGATISSGLLGLYGGIAGERGPRPRGTQVERLARLDAERPVDAVLVSIGANDVNFERLVRRCAVVADCPNARLDPAQPEDADAVEAAALTRLAGRYDELAAALAPIVAPATPAAPGPVVLSEYFDPLSGPGGKTCSQLFGGALTGAELQWAEDAVLEPLNGEASAAAHRNGWSFAGGIAADFAGHGYCAGAADRWVNTAGESLPALRGTLHPNAAGHLAIADDVAAPLAIALGLMRPPKPAAAATTRGPGDHTLLILAIVAALLVAFFAVILTVAATRDAAVAWVRRIWYLLRRSRLPDPVGARRRKRARLEPLLSTGTDAPGALAQAALKAAAALLAGVVSLGFVAFVGGAIETVRFWAARYPVDQAVNAISRQQLLVVGAQALAIFALLGVAAVICLWLLDSTGRPVRATRRGVAFLILAELVAAVVVGQYGLRQGLHLAVGFAVAVWLGLFVVDIGLAVVPGFVRKPALRPAMWRQLRGYFFAPANGSSLPQRALRIARDTPPLALLAVALWQAAVLEHASDRLVFVLVPVALAAIGLVAPWSPAAARWAAAGGGAAPAVRDRRAAGLVPARALVAAILLVCLAAFLVRDELWLAGAALAAVVLSALVLTIGHVSRDRFLPFAITVFLAAGLYGTVLSCLRTIDAPQAQPVAVLDKSGRAVCGVWAGDGGGRLWIGQIELSERGAHRRPAPRRSRLISVADADQVDSAIGPLQPIGRALDQAVVLRDTLREQHRDMELRDVGARCRPQAAAPPPVPTPARAIAERVQPELVVDRRDGFWPVPVRTLFAMEDRRARVCRRVADHVCVRLTTQGDLPWAGGEGEWLDYPADGLHIGDERKLTQDALGSLDPDRTAAEYFLVSRGGARLAPWSVQFWFFYTFNYQPLGFGHAGYHEGDWESVALILSARTRRPRYVWMARHQDEGQVFAWDEPALRRVNGRLEVFAAKGSHADYEDCLRKDRPAAPAGLIDDRPQCAANEQLHLSPESTPLTDLARASFACWHGRYGHHPGDQIRERLPYEAADGPLGPLWQQHFGGTASEPCRGVGDPGRRDGPGEEVVDEPVASRLRARAGRLDPLVDSCSDWERPPASGVYLVACSPHQLAGYLSSGLEDPGPSSLHIDSLAKGALAAGPASVPAVRRDTQLRRMDHWRIAATGPITAEVYAACQAGNARLEVRFPLVRFDPQQRLRLDDRLRNVWRLRDEDGAAVARATPRVVSGHKPRRLACSAVDEH